MAEVLNLQTQDDPRPAEMISHGDELLKGEGPHKILWSAAGLELVTRLVTRFGRRRRANVTLDLQGQLAGTGCQPVLHWATYG